MNSVERRASTAAWQWVALAVIVTAAFALRVYRLGDAPAGLFCDEAANGYNAWSLLHTGRDEHGKLFPLFVWSFFAFKYPLDIYPTMIWVGLFGLTEFATRFQAALYGTGTVLVTFFIGRRLFTPVAGLAAAATLAVMPWHIHFSRIAFGLIGFTFWFGLGFYFLVRALGDGATRRDWTAAAAAFALCFYMYAVSQLLVPIFVGAAVLMTAPTVWRRRRWALRALIVGLLISVPFVLFYALNSERASVYVMQTSVLAQPGALADKVRLILAENWPTYFGRAFLFDSGDPILRHGVRGHGMLYTSMALWIALGVVACVVSGGRTSKLLLLWLILYPLGAAVTRETPSATRSILGSVAFALLAGIGFGSIVSLLRRVPWAPVRGVAVAAVLAVAALPLGWQTKAYLKSYFVDYPTYAAAGIEGFQYGYRDLFRILEERRRPGDQIFYSTTSVNNPYIFYLFYTKRPPLRRSEWGNADIEYPGVRPTQLERWYKPGVPTLFAVLPTDMWFFESWDDRVDIIDPGGKATFVLLENPRPKRLVDPWELMGPFPNPNNRERLAGQVDPRTMQPLEPPVSGEPRWEPYSGEAGVVELNVYLSSRVPGAGNNPEFVTAYMRTTLHSTSDHTSRLELVGSRDEMLLWLDAEPLTPKPIELTEFELRTVDLPLKKGDNVLFLKTIETVGDWWFAGYLAAEGGGPDREVTVTTGQR
jgi:4-amino-4-deoxy-L-arabinose transferase-like glycosyltransferase